MKVAICYNNDIRDNGTAFYCRYALERMEGVECIFVPWPPRQEVPKADLYLYVDDGQDWIKDHPPSPSAYWAIDTHLGFPYREWKAKHFDRAYAAQKDGAAKLRSREKPCSWLPLACSPDHHCDAGQLREKGMTVEKNWDIGFVGFLARKQGNGWNDRVAILDFLFEQFPNSWFGTNRFHEQMSWVYCCSRLGFNVSIGNDLNMRVFEVMSTGTPLLTNSNVEGIDELFEPHLYLGWETLEQMKEVAEKWLKKSDPTSELMGGLAKKRVRNEHTYTHRMQTILEDFKHA